MSWPTLSIYASYKPSVLRYLNDLLSKLNKEGKPNGIQHLLKAKKISDDISAYRQRVQTAKEDFLVGGLLSSLSFTLERAADPYNDHGMSRSLRCPPRSYHGIQRSDWFRGGIGAEHNINHQGQHRRNTDLGCSAE